MDRRLTRTARARQTGLATTRDGRAAGGYHAGGYARVVRPVGDPRVGWLARLAVLLRRQ